MTDAIAKYEQPAVIAPVDIAAELPQIFRLASALIKATGFIPAHLKNEGEIAAVILAGRELGLQPMVSLRSIAMVKGKPVLAADVMLGLMLRAGVKHEWVADGSPAQGNVARIKLVRAGHEPYVSSFSLEDAQRAGLASNDNYKKHQGAMLRARAVSAGGRAYCPDILSGCYVPGELGEDEPQPAARATKQRKERTLDDVAAAPAAEVSAPHEETKAEPPPAYVHDEYGEVVTTPGAYTQNDHIAALSELTTVVLLRAWMDDLAQFNLDANGKKNAALMMRKHCAAHGIDPQEVLS